MLASAALCRARLLPVPTAIAAASSLRKATAPALPAVILRMPSRLVRSPAPNQRLFSSAAGSSAAGTMSWTEYFGHKRRAKSFELASSVASFTVFLVAGSYYFMAVKEFDPTELVFGVMDASVAYSMGALAVGAAGAVVGVFGGSALWRVTADKRVLQAIDRLDKQFFERVKKFRPQGQLRLSLQDPLPDYYAESVKSVADYRAWLKKQRNYRIKTEGFKAMKSIKRKPSA